MNTREKFRYMAFGGALVFLGMLGAMMSPLTAEKDKFGEIECTRLVVVDSETGKAGASLSVDAAGGSLRVYDNHWGLMVNIGVKDHGGHVSAIGKNGKSRASRCL